MANYETATEFVKIQPEKIEVAESPDPTAEGYDPLVYKFFNPRSRSKGGGFDKEPMKELENSIIKTGLQLPLLLRQMDNGPELIAGERRLQAILNIKKKKKNGKPILVYNIQTEKEELADKVYKTIFVRIIEGCEEETALGLAVDENEQSQPLTTHDQFQLVKNMIETGIKPAEIAKRLNKNPAWVNHTQHFEENLPTNCFEALMAGDISRHVATELLKYDKVDREEIWEEATAVLTGKRGKKKEQLEASLEEAAGQSEVADANVELVDELGLNEEEAATSQVKAEVNLEEAETALETFDEQSEPLTGGDITEAGVSTDNKPKTPSAFNKKKIESHYVDPLRQALGIEAGGEPDESVKFKDTVTGRVFPKQLLQCSLEISEAIINQHKDVFEVLREFMYESGKWEREEEEE